MKAELQFALSLNGVGLLLSCIGLLHRRPALAQWDARSFQTLHTCLRPYSGFFRYLWPLGTTPVGVLLILILFIPGWQTGLSATTAYILGAICERTIKLKMRRPRPFDVLPDVTINQPNEPRDPSHPSGDTLRVWFLALVFPLAFALPWPIFALTFSIAMTLSLGRIALGVHYPLDVIGGAGLGLLAASVAIISYQLIVTR